MAEFKQDGILKIITTYNVTHRFSSNAIGPVKCMLCGHFMTCWGNWAHICCKSYPCGGSIYRRNHGLSWCNIQGSTTRDISITQPLQNVQRQSATYHWDVSWYYKLSWVACHLAIRINPTCNFDNGGFKGASFIH